jgi:membrane fusion protein, multidrug efflux system
MDVRSAPAHVSASLRGGRSAAPEPEVHVIRKILLAGAAGAAVLGLGAGGAYLRSHAAGPGEDAASAISLDAGDSFAADLAIPVEGATVVEDALVLAVSATGQASAPRRTTVLAQIEGRVAAVGVRENDRVLAGGLLVALDPAEYELVVQEARARLRQAGAEFRAITLFDARIEDDAVRAERGAVARAKSGLDGAEVALRRAELNLERARVRAPFAGRVADVRVTPGQWVRAGEELVTVLDLDPIAVEVQVLEGELRHLSAGGHARVSFAAFPDETHVGRIDTVNPLVERETRTARVRVIVPNPDGRILPGMYARVSLDARRFAGRVLVPRSAILERDRRTMLFVYEEDERGGLARWRYVTTGLRNDDLIEIVPSSETDLVAPGEVVLTAGHFTLIHDARVRLVGNVRQAGGRPD